ncbi:MAG: Gfo/Idh/MocA family protein [Eubacteriales bacterium]
MSVNVGVLGFAHGHVMSYGRKWKDNPELGVTLVAGWDENKDRLKQSAEALGIEQIASCEEMLARDDIEAVVISSETAFHADLVEKAAAAKKKIILYKPMALTLRQADRIVAAVEEHGVPFTMGWQMRVDPQNVKMKELIETQAIGRVSIYKRRHGLGTHLWNGFENTWHADPVLNRDIFADDSSHPIDMLNWIFGVPETVSAELSTIHNPKVVNDTGIALFKYPDGKIAEICCSFICSASEITTEVYGERGTIQQYYGDNPGTRLPRPEGLPGLKWFVEGESDWTKSDIPSPATHGERIAGQAAPLADFLNGRRPAICSARDGRNSLRMVLACYLSAREGTRVRIDDERVYEI